MNRVIVNAPRWLTWGFVLMVIGALLFLVGWIKPYLHGPDVSATIYRTRPVPVQVETVKWLMREKERVRVQTVRVEVPVEVIREVSPQVEQRLENDFGLTLPELRAENRELVDVLAVPRAPHGGQMALTVNTDSGKINGVFRATAQPAIEFGGLREAGAAWNPLNRSVEGYYRQDLVRLGPAIVNGRAFATSAGDYGVSIGVAVRF